MDTSSSCTIQRCLLMMGHSAEPIYDCPAGNVCGLVGVDEYLLKSGTLTDSEACWPFHTMKFSVAAVVQVAVAPKQATDLPKLIEGLNRLSKADQIVKTSVSKSGENIIAGAGELHLEVCLNDLRKKFMNNAEIIVSEPIVSFGETITQRTGENKSFPATCISKSPNKHNRLFMYASPLSEKFIKGVEDGDICTGKISDRTPFARFLSEKYDWDVNDAKKIWTFGCPPDGIPNVVVDTTKGVQFLSEIEEHVVSAFREVTNAGILCEEVLRGVRFNLEDVKLHPDSIHRGPGQIIPCAKKVFYGCQLASGPRLLEPIYLVEITVDMSAQPGVYSTLGARRGVIVDVQTRPGTPLSLIRAHLPVVDSFGFTQLLRENTGGKAFPQMKFSHWKEMPGDPMKEGTQAYVALMKTRKRKGLKEQLPSFNDYFDKITLLKK